MGKIGTPFHALMGGPEKARGRKVVRRRLDGQGGKGDYLRGNN